VSAPTLPPLRLGFPLDPTRLGASHAHGPGRRIPLFVSGCSLRCTAVCLNPHLLEASDAHAHPVEEVAGALLRIARHGLPPAEGVTVLGGEPTDQLAALTALCVTLRAAGLTTMVYTGLVLEELRCREGATALLAEVDLLVDGPFREDLYDPLLAWRGSSNQRLLSPTGRYPPAALRVAWARQRLANYKAPRHVVAVDALPVNATGKVVKQALRDRAAAELGPA